mgnify:CR=1 FL=1
MSEASITLSHDWALAVFLLGIAGLCAFMLGLSSLLGGGSSLSESLLSNISSMDGVRSAFTALGMDSGMIQQFVPVIMSFLGNQGVGSSLLGQLQGLWTPDA